MTGAADTPALAGILGAGLISSLGRGERAHARALALPPPLAGSVAADELEPGKRLPYLSAEGSPLLEEMVATAVSDAVSQAGLDAGQVGAMGLFLGSSSLDIGVSERTYAAENGRGEAARPMAGARSGYGALAETVGRRFGIDGPRLTFNTACSSSANAALYAARMIARGELAHALILGTESFNRLSLLGFASLMLVSEHLPRPFDARRDGLVLGEGVGALVLGPAGPTQRARLCGGANLCDTSSATNSRPEAIARVMSDALADAGIGPEALTAIKAHGTSTPSNDQAEGEGMRQLFGDRLPPFTSMKGHLGHTLGACGALETAALLASLEAGYLPTTAGFGEPDPALELHPVTEPAAAGDGLYLLNYFGFGGNNTSLVVRYGS